MKVRKVAKNFGRFEILKRDLILQKNKQLDKKKNRSRKNENAKQGQRTTISRRFN